MQCTNIRAGEVDESEEQVDRVGGTVRGEQVCRGMSLVVIECTVQ